VQYGLAWLTERARLLSAHGQRPDRVLRLRSSRSVMMFPLQVKSGRGSRWRQSCGNPYAFDVSIDGLQIGWRVVRRNRDGSAVAFQQAVMGSPMCTLPSPSIRPSATPRPSLTSISPDAPASVCDAAETYLERPSQSEPGFWQFWSPADGKRNVRVVYAAHCHGDVLQATSPRPILLRAHDALMLCR
jgi:hypothetical protein